MHKSGCKEPPYIEINHNITQQSSDNIDIAHPIGTESIHIAQLTRRFRTRHTGIPSQRAVPGRPGMA
jgi:hypothetical protein